MFMIWIEDYIKTFGDNEIRYILYEYSATESIWLEERIPKMIPKEYEERRTTTMLEF